MGLKKIFNCCNSKENADSEKDGLADLAKQYETEDHILSPEQLVINHETHLENGLTNEKAQEKLETFGKNELTPPKEKHILVKFLLKLFFDIFNILLLAGFGGCIIAYIILKTSGGNPTGENIYLAIALAAVVIITTIFGTYQEYSSGKKMKAFKNFLPQHVNVYRDGELVELLASEIVPGDILSIKAGDKIPADLRVIKASLDAKVDNSSITGESDPQLRGPDMTSKEPLETQNICFFGTLFVQGNALCMVINTGDNTLLGGIAKLTSSTNTETTPIGREIHHFVKLISIIAIILGLSLGIANGLKTKNAIKTLVLIIGIIVANVPEGLLVTMTVSLTLASKEMSKKSVLVKNLECVETLGSTSVICSDKTGTLTINKMTVSHIYYDSKEREINTHDQLKGEFDRNDETFKHFIRSATLCNNAKYNKDNIIIGDASESALVKFANPNIGQTIDEYRQSREKVHGIPFNSKNKWQLSIHKDESENSTHIIVMKGAPERVLNFCDRVLVNGELKPFDEEARQQVQHGIDSFAKQGERVLGFCELELDKEAFPEGFKFEGDSPEKANFPFKKDESNKGFVFLGLAAMIDPPRPSVPQSVLKCQSAGIRVFMVTGDHPTTARAIATKVNIISPEEEVLDLNSLENPTLQDMENSTATAIVITGALINHFTNGTCNADDFWNKALHFMHIVFARTSPQHKLLIVEACQKRNAIVAVTGDGVNDSPALKKADIGIAMGVAGTDVAKEAADMILMDDNFSSIVNGVEEGRVLFDNLKKSIAYTLSSNIPEISPIMLKLFIGVPLPLKTIQILLIDLGTDMVPAISMAYERKEADIMSMSPRNPKTERLVTRHLIAYSYLLIGILQMFAGFFTYLVVFYFSGFGWNQLLYLDKNEQFESCDLANKYLTCSTTNEFNGKYCQYSGTILAPRYDRYTVFNMQCEQRTKILGEANAAYVISIVIVQIADVMISKTRRNSVFLQGMKNKIMNFGILFETALICFLVYTPPIAKGLSFSMVHAIFLVPALPFFMVIFGFDELRKLMIRKNFSGWVKRNTYW